MTVVVDSRLLTPVTPMHRLNWKIWQKKNFNIHRGVIEFTASPNDSIDAIASSVRDGVRAEFRPAWWRGFGFGAIIHFQELPDDFTKICQQVDTRNKRHGVWQWIIVCLDDEKVALGIHTWLHGYLRPVYDTALLELASNGFRCYSTDAEVDVFIATLRRISVSCQLIRGIQGIIS